MPKSERVNAELDEMQAAWDGRDKARALRLPISTDRAATSDSGPRDLHAHADRDADREPTPPARTGDADAGCRSRRRPRPW